MISHQILSVRSLDFLQSTLALSPSIFRHHRRKNRLRRSCLIIPPSNATFRQRCLQSDAALGQDHPLSTSQKLTAANHGSRQCRSFTGIKKTDGTSLLKFTNYSSSEKDDDLFPPPPPYNTGKKKLRCKKKKTTPKIQKSTSSADSGLFSSESFDDDDINDEETETLVSCSRSLFSSDSSLEFNANLETIHETMPMRHKKKKKKKKSKKVKNAKRNVMMRLSTSLETESPARLSSCLQRMVVPCRVEGKLRESFTVVKKSEDPYVDFQRSMMEMILEKQMFEDKDLEQLLQCFLSLNSRHHHGLIVQAFAEILESFVLSKID